MAFDPGVDNVWDLQAVSPQPFTHLHVRLLGGTFIVADFKNALRSEDVTACGPQIALPAFKTVRDPRARKNCPSYFTSNDAILGLDPHYFEFANIKPLTLRRGICGADAVVQFARTGSCRL